MGNFEFDGEKYKKASRHQKEWGNSLISTLILNGRETILDLGCGDGVLTAQLSGLVPDGEVLGVDASRGMIRSAQRLERENLSFACMDIDEMDFDNRFDLIYSNAALHWVKDHRRLLHNSLNALKPGGSIAWNFAGEGTCRFFNAAVKEAMELPEFKEWFSDFQWPWYMPKVDDYTEMVSESGFQNYNVKVENKDRYFADSSELIKWIDQPCLVPFLQQLPESKKESFREEVIENMLENTMLSDGRCFETFRRINAVAYKQVLHGDQKSSFTGSYPMRYCWNKLRRCPINPTSHIPRWPL